MFEEECSTEEVEECETVLENQCTTSTVCQDILHPETALDVTEPAERSLDEALDDGGKEKCLKRTDVQCSLVSSPVCVTVTRTEQVEQCEEQSCHTKLEEEEDCSTRLEEVCSTQVVGAGETIQTCGQQPRHTCQTVPVEVCQPSCHTTPVQVEVEECEEQEKEECEEVEDCGECRPVPVTDCQQSPVQSCSLVPRHTCRQVASQKPKQVCQ